MVSFGSEKQTAFAQFNLYQKFETMKIFILRHLFW